MKRRILALASAAALTIGLAPPAQAAPSVELRPAELERGANVRIPHLVGTTVVHRRVRIKLDAGAVRLLGKSGKSYIVGLSNKDGTGKFRTVRLGPKGGRTVLFRDVPIWDLALASDGDAVIAARANGKRTRIRVYDARTGAVEASRRFRGSLTVLDMEGRRLVAGGFGPNRTLRWNVATGAVTKVSGRAGNAADISADRLATFTKDPYNGGCTVVTTLSRPAVELWRSCAERVDTFSPAGTRMATIPILSDGVGPSEVWLRQADGELLASYNARWFGPVSWESEKVLLLDTNGRKKSATVRCRIAACTRASALQQVPAFRVGMRALRDAARS